MIYIAKLINWERINDTRLNGYIKTAKPSFPRRRESSKKITGCHT
jgi:hypothetical protein